MVKLPPWRWPSSSPAPAQGLPGGCGWAARHSQEEDRSRARRGLGLGLDPDPHPNPEEDRSR